MRPAAVAMACLKLSCKAGVKVSGVRDASVSESLTWKVDTTGAGAVVVVVPVVVVAGAAVVDEVAVLVVGLERMLHPVVSLQQVNPSTSAGTGEGRCAAAHVSGLDSAQYARTQEPAAMSAAEHGRPRPSAASASNRVHKPWRSGSEQFTRQFARTDMQY